MRGRLIAIGGLFFAVAVLAVLVAPERLQAVVAIQSAGANEIVLPVGYWVALAVWTWFATRIVGLDAVQVACRAIAAGFAVHVLLALVPFASRLDARSDFSTPFYWLYARTFYAAVLACATAWAVDRLRRRGFVRPARDVLDLPVMYATVVLVLATVRHDPASAVVGVAAGSVLGLRLATASSAIGRLVADERLFLVGVFLLALALRLLYTRRVMSNPDFLETGGDGPTYDRLAWSVAEGHGIPASFRQAYPLLLLGYAWFIGAIYAIAGHSYFAACAVQSVLGAAACLVVYQIAKPMFGSGVARVTAVFAALSFQLVFSAAALGHQAVDIFLTACLVWLLVEAVSRGQDGWLRWALIGIVFGCAIAVRETNAILLAFVAPWMLWSLGRPRRRRAITAVVAMLIGIALVVTPLMAPMVSSSDSRLGLRRHMDRLFKGQGDYVKTRTDLAAPFADPGAALAQIRQKPRFFIVTLARAMTHNFAVQFFTQPYGGFDLVFLVKSSSYYYVMWAYAYAFAFAGLVMAAMRIAANGRQAASVALVLGVLVSRTAPHLVLESAYHHRPPIEPFLIMLAAFGAVSLFAAAFRASAGGRAALSQGAS